MDNTTAAKLQAAGVKDCKLLTDKKILELEDVIKSTVVDFSVLELKPKIYNLRYEQVAAAGGKLNQLLGYGHVAALSQVLERQKDCHSALIDQFTQSTVNLKALQQRFPGCSVRQQPKAESNLAVALLGAGPRPLLADDGRTGAAGRRRRAAEGRRLAGNGLRPPLSRKIRQGCFA